MTVRRRVFGWETAGGAEQHFRIDLPWTAINPERFELHRGGEEQLRQMYRDGAVDVVFAHRLAGWSSLWHDICLDPKVLAVYDMDDDILAIDPSNTVPYAVFHPLEDGTTSNVCNADVITVSSEGLRQKYASAAPPGGQCYILPMVIPDWLPEMPFTPTFNQDRAVVGWAGSMHKAQDWGATGLAEELAAVRLRLRGWGVSFQTVGGDYTQGLLGGAHSHRPFTTVQNYYESIGFNIGLAPLMDSPFNQGKTTTKLIEYGARGVPTIASPVGDYERWITRGVDGSIVCPSNDWAWHISELVRDPTHRRELGLAAWEHARQHTISRMVHHWEEVFSMEVGR